MLVTDRRYSKDDNEYQFGPFRACSENKYSLKQKDERNEIFFPKTMKTLFNSVWKYTCQKFRTISNLLEYMSAIQVQLCIYLNVTHAFSLIKRVLKLHVRYCHIQNCNDGCSVGNNVNNQHSQMSEASEAVSLLLSQNGNRAHFFVCSHHGGRKRSRKEHDVTPLALASQPYLTLLATCLHIGLWVDFSPLGCWIMYIIFLFMVIFSGACLKAN